jgi:glycosyltransferase involved in cell wall biosynthesis
MKPHRVAILFDCHTPYLAFRVNALLRELVRLGHDKHIELHVILVAADWSSYGWVPQKLQELYDVPVHVLAKEFHGLGLRAFFHPSLLKVLPKLATLFLKLRPRLTLAGGYDRPTSLLCRVLSYFFLGKVGVMNDSRFNDAESFSKSAPLEFIKSLVVSRYSFFLCPGRESADYHRFLGGKNKPVFTKAWDVVDNESIAKAADDSTHDAEIRQRFGLADDAKFFFLPARFVAKKNIPFVLRAYASYLRMLDAAPQKLVLCGQGPDKELIEATIRELSLEDHVKLCEWLPYEMMPRACRLSTALILASTHDQWGMTVNEALSAGTPVLVSNRCGAHELVENNVNGFTFDPTDAAHFLYLLRQLHGDPALLARLRSNAAPSMRRFSITQYLERHLQLFTHYGLLPAGVVQPGPAIHQPSYLS